MARPKKEISSHQLEALMRLKPTLLDTAAFFQCSEDTIERFIKTQYGVSFAEFRQQKMVKTRHDLVRWALKAAEKGNTAMLIFCLKNMCGWTDKPVADEGDGNITITLAYDPKDPKTYGYNTN